jgi:hypothetical protein
MDRPTAWGFLVTNLLVLPGLGSVMAGRKVGYLQIPIALGGMILTLTFAIVYVREWIVLRALPLPSPRLLLLGALGVFLFLLGLCWALATSLSLLREASRQPPPPARKSHIAKVN